VSVAKLAEQLPRSDQPYEGVVKRFVPVDVWIDDKSRLRRITIREPEDPDNDNPAMTITVELYDYGVEVDVEPPAEETISEQEFDRLTSTASGMTEQVEGEEVSPEEACQSARKELPEKQADRLCQELRENG
jgi:hypothetical protein